MIRVIPIYISYLYLTRDRAKACTCLFIRASSVNSRWWTGSNGAHGGVHARNGQPRLDDAAVASSEMLQLKARMEKVCRSAIFTFSLDPVRVSGRRCWRFRAGMTKGNTRRWQRRRRLS